MRRGTLWLEATANEAEAIANFMLQTEGEPTPERAVTLHEAWLQWRESEQNLQHPLAPIRAGLDTRDNSKTNHKSV